MKDFVRHRPEQKTLPDRALRNALVARWSEVVTRPTMKDFVQHRHEAKTLSACALRNALIAKWSEVVTRQKTRFFRAPDGEKKAPCRPLLFPPEARALSAPSLGVARNRLFVIDYKG